MGSNFYIDKLLTLQILQCFIFWTFTIMILQNIKTQLQNKYSRNKYLHPYKYISKSIVAVPKPFFRPCSLTFIWPWWFRSTANCCLKVMFASFLLLQKWKHHEIDKLIFCFYFEAVFCSPDISNFVFLHLEVDDVTYLIDMKSKIHIL